MGDVYRAREPHLEREPLMRLAEEGQLQCYEHKSWWMPMDTRREYELLNQMWEEGSAPWKVWHE